MTTTAPIREAPAPDPLHRWVDTPSHPPVPNEPVLNVDDIQGNILAGFNKDFQLLLCLRIDDAKGFRGWLASQVPYIASTAEVLAFNRLYKAIRRRRRGVRDVDGTGSRTEPDAVTATWVNIAFSHAGLRKLIDGTDLSKEQDFADAAFREGLAKRSPLLGDPVGEGVEGNPENWPVGGPGNEADVILIVASDNRADLAAEVVRIMATLQKVAGAWTDLFPGLPKNLDEIATALTRGGDGSPEIGANLTGTLAGHEHFGFLDGVSQPGLRGRISTHPRDVLTPRQNPNDRDQGKPGQDLLWPGEFVFGYPGQSADPEGSVADPSRLTTAGPRWATNGSFLVFRRLRQDVFAFDEFLRDTAGKQQMAPEALGARLVGRWPSGAPVVRSPDADNVDLGDTDCANNHFEFNEKGAPIPPAGVENRFDCTDVRFPPAMEDPDGAVCPFAAHVRKVYPRDDESKDTSKGPAGQCADVRAKLNEVETQTHRVLRRGIPFGPQVARTEVGLLDATTDDGKVRGLYFLAYQTSIERQFEFVTRCWVNNPDFKEPGAGHDPIIGQNGAPGQGRLRRFRVSVRDGKEVKQHELMTDRQWVIPAGGGYFFAPSISALEMLATAGKAAADVTTRQDSQVPAASAALVADGNGWPWSE